MATYIYTWYPPHKSHPLFKAGLDLFKIQGYYHGPFSYGSGEYIKRGSRIFLMCLNGKKTGIIASGLTVSDPYQCLHWKKAMHNKKAAINTAILFDVWTEMNAVLPLSELTSKVWNKPTFWKNRTGGRKIESPIDAKLEDVWKKHLNLIKPFPQKIIPYKITPKIKRLLGM